MCIPAKLSFSVYGSMPGGCHSTVSIDGDAVVYESVFNNYGGNPVPDDVHVKRTPTTAQWNRFIDQLEAIGVWNWRSSYQDLNVLDGGGWSFEVVAGSRKIRSSGHNDYPGDDGKPAGSPSGSAAFSRLIAALSELVGHTIR